MNHIMTRIASFNYELIFEMKKLHETHNIELRDGRGG